MEEQKQYLTEKNYQKGKRILIIISVLVLIVGLTMGGFLIYKGADYKENVNYKINNQEKKDKQELSEIKEKKSELSEKISAKDYECASLDINSENYFQENNKCQGESDVLKSELLELKTKEVDLTNKDYNFDKEFDSFDSYIYFGVGIFIIILAFIISILIIIFAKKREITAFTMQQTMPLAQEGIEKMTPTIGKAAGTIARDITSGINDGVSKNKDNN